jgi:hypothetical protein
MRLFAQNWIRVVNSSERSRDSPITQHAEPGYAAALEFEEACKIGARFKQDAIYYVSSGTLFVSHCDHRRGLKPITKFSKRVDSNV